MISSVPALAIASSACSVSTVGLISISSCAELRLQAVLHRVGKLPGKFQLIGGVEFGLELDGLDRRPAQPQRVDAHAVLTARHRLDLQRAAQGVRVVLQRDDALTAEVSGSIVTMPPLTSRGELGNPLMMDSKGSRYPSVVTSSLASTTSDASC